MPIRVVVVDDSAIARALLRTALEADGDIRVVGEAPDGLRALEAIRAHAPDLATIDLSMPDVDGLEVIAEIMAVAPLPILVVTSSADDAAVLEAARRGALEVARKPGPGKGAELRGRVRRLAQIPVIRHVAGRRRPPAPSPEPPADARRRLVAIAASAGGPPALHAILRALPRDLDAAVAIVQHLPVGYADAFARELSQVGALPVTCVRSIVDLAPGRAFLAPDDRHLVLTPGGRLAPEDTPPVLGHRPSATVFFRSVARWAARSAMGIVLTGIGTDGAEGLREMRDKGALTIAQDEASAAVYGMPRAAREIGAATRVLPLDQMAQAIVRAVGSR